MVSSAHVDYVSELNKADFVGSPHGAAFSLAGTSPPIVEPQPNRAEELLALTRPQVPNANVTKSSTQKN
jgi:hypothetical protein